MDKHSMFFIGLDLGDRYSHLAILDRDGEVVEETRLPTSPASFQRKFTTFAPSRVALEVGTHSRWASHLIRELDHDVLVANPRQLRAIYHNPRKGDRVDAQTLARLARLDPHLLAPIRHRSAQAQAHLALIRSRDALVRSRTALINHVRGVVKSSGARLPASTADNFSQKAASAIPLPLQPALLPILDTIAALTHDIVAYDRQIETLCQESYPETVPLRRISGVGPLTALAFVLSLEDPQRFPKSRQVGPALGLVPRRDQSGNHEPQLPITKAGDTYLRQLLVNCAHYILGPFGPDCDLRRWGLQIAERGGKNAKKRAVIAVARKLAVLLHHLWKTGETYEPFFQSGQPDQEPAILAPRA